VQATWMAAVSAQKPAVSLPAVPITVEGVAKTYHLYVPKAMIISADSVKTKFKGFFPMIQEQSAEDESPVAASAVNPKRRKRTYKGNFAATRQTSHGMGDSQGDKAQHSENKANAKFWCRKILGASLNNKNGALLHRSEDVMTDSAYDDFDNATRNTMTPAQVAETSERLGSAKSDDLADAMFMAFYAADFIVPSIWLRALGPTAKRKSTRYTYCETPPANMNVKSPPEARYQTLFAYLKYRVRPSEKILSEISNALK